MHSLNEIYPDKEKNPMFPRNQTLEKPNVYLTNPSESHLITRNFQLCNQLKTILECNPSMLLRGRRAGAGARSRLLTTRRGLGLAGRRDTLGASRGRRRVGLVAAAADLLEGGRDVGGQRGRGTAGRGTARGRTAGLRSGGRGSRRGSAGGRGGEVAGGISALLVVLGGAGLGWWGSGRRRAGGG